MKKITSLLFIITNLTYAYGAQLANGQAQYISATNSEKASSESKITFEPNTLTVFDDENVKGLPYVGTWINGQHIYNPNGFLPQSDVLHLVNEVQTTETFNHVYSLVRPEILSLLLKPQSNFSANIAFHGTRNMAGICKSKKIDSSYFGDHRDVTYFAGHQHKNEAFRYAGDGAIMAWLSKISPKSRYHWEICSNEFIPLLFFSKKRRPDLEPYSIESPVAYKPFHYTSVNSIEESLKKDPDNTLKNQFSAETILLHEFNAINRAKNTHTYSEWDTETQSFIIKEENIDSGQNTNSQELKDDKTKIDHDLICPAHTLLYTQKLLPIKGAYSQKDCEFYIKNYFENGLSAPCFALQGADRSTKFSTGLEGCFIEKTKNFGQRLAQHQPYIEIDEAHEIKHSTYISCTTKSLHKGIEFIVRSSRNAINYKNYFEKHILPEYGSARTSDFDKKRNEIYMPLQIEGQDIVACKVYGEQGGKETTLLYKNHLFKGLYKEEQEDLLKNINYTTLCTIGLFTKAVQKL